MALNGTASATIDGQPTLTVHIGTHKTGSSSIQFAALANRERLVAAGTHLVRAGSGDYTKPHHNLAFDLTDRADFQPDKGGITDAEREIAEIDAPNALISTESLCGMIDHAAKYERIRALADRLGRKLRIIVCLREQLSYINSLYAFGARRFAHSSRFEPFVTRTARHARLRYPALLAPWRDIADELVVFKFGSNVLPQFFGLLNTTIEGDFYVNTPVGPKSVEAMRSLRKRHERLFEPSQTAVVGNRFRKREDRFRAKMDGWGWNEQSFWGFEDALADQVAAIYADDNDALFAEYGVDFRTRPANRAANAFDRKAAEPAEREEFDAHREILWEMLSKYNADRPGPA
jgi:hypothetical protein